MSMPTCGTGDKGQRYEIRCKDETGSEVIIGWSHNSDSFKRVVELHPCFYDRKVIDRQAGDPRHE